MKKTSIPINEPIQTEKLCGYLSTKMDWIRILAWRITANFCRLCTWHKRIQHRTRYYFLYQSSFLSYFPMRFNCTKHSKQSAQYDDTRRVIVNQKTRLTTISGDQHTSSPSAPTHQWSRVSSCSLDNDLTTAFVYAICIVCSGSKSCPRRNMAQKENRSEIESVF